MCIHVYMCVYIYVIHMRMYMYASVYVMARVVVLASSKPPLSTSEVLRYSRGCSELSSHVSTYIRIQISISVSVSQGSPLIYLYRYICVHTQTQIFSVYRYIYMHLNTYISISISASISIFRAFSKRLPDRAAQSCCSASDLGRSALPGLMNSSRYWKYTKSKGFLIVVT